MPATQGVNAYLSGARREPPFLSSLSHCLLLSAFNQSILDHPSSSHQHILHLINHRIKATFSPAPPLPSPIYPTESPLYQSTLLRPHPSLPREKWPSPTSAASSSKPGPRLRRMSTRGMLWVEFFYLFENLEACSVIHSFIHSVHRILLFHRLICPPSLSQSPLLTRQNSASCLHFCALPGQSLYVPCCSAYFAWMNRTDGMLTSRPCDGGGVAKVLQSRAVYFFDCGF